MTTKTIARRVPLSMGLPRQEYWNGLPCLTGSSCPKDQTCASCVSSTEPLGKPISESNMHQIQDIMKGGDRRERGDRTVPVIHDLLHF